MGELIINCTISELDEIMDAHSSTIDFVEPDMEVTLVPEVDLSESPVQEAASSLAEAQHAFLVDPVDGPVPTNLDRIDSRSGLDGRVNLPPNGGAGVHIFLMDTGIRTTHVEFAGRAIPSLESYDLEHKVVCEPTDTTCANDDNGHGTHCAATVVGASVGVAKGAIVHAVKTMADDGRGSTSGIVQAMYFVLESGLTPAVVSSSVSGVGKSKTLNAMISIMVKNGVAVVVAAGNKNDDACRFTPSNAGDAITVGATTLQDKKASFSNFGSCVDIFAPGVKVMSASHHGDNKSAKLSGTSMACPAVVGAVAILLGNGATPDAARAELMQRATPISIWETLEGSPDRLLFVDSESPGTTVTTTLLTTTTPPMLLSAQSATIPPTMFKAAASSITGTFPLSRSSNTFYTSVTANAAHGDSNANAVANAEPSTSAEAVITLITETTSTEATITLPTITTAAMTSTTPLSTITTATTISSMSSAATVFAIEGTTTSTLASPQPSACNPRARNHNIIKGVSLCGMLWLYSVRV
jgi:subtilisin family serine protease